MSSNIEVFVEIELLHENRLYVIKRSQSFNKTSNNCDVKCTTPVLKVSYQEKNGEMQEISSYECANTINKILPEALSAYFFFDGERISDINNKGDVVSAVRGLMGLEVISEAVDHFSPQKSNSVISKLTRELDLGQDSKSQMLMNDLSQSKDQLNAYEERLVHVQKEIEYLEGRKKDLDEIILANADTRARQQEKLRVEKDIDYLEQNKETLDNSLVKNFTKNAFKFFAIPLYEKIIGIIDSSKNLGEGIPEMHSKAIDFILERGKCICGADLTQNQGAVNHINYERSLLPPEHIGTTIRTFKTLCMQYMREVEDYSETVVESYKAIRNNSNHLDDKKAHLNELSRLLRGNVDVGKYERENADITQQLNSKRSLALSISQRIGETKNKIQSLETSINGLRVATEKNARINKYLAYAKKVYEWFKNSYDSAESRVKEELYDSINSLFVQMYHGTRKVEIDDNYHIVLKIDDGHGTFVTDTSPGLDAVKNFAFIAGIVDLARKRAQEKPEDDSSDSMNLGIEPYPIVMDAPFSNADGTHVANISKVLPQVAEQVILIVMNKDWQFAEKDMSSRVGKRYQIVKHSEVYSSIEVME